HEYRLRWDKCHKLTYLTSGSDGAQVLQLAPKARICRLNRLDKLALTCDLGAQRRVAPQHDTQLAMLLRLPHEGQLVDGLNGALLNAAQPLFRQPDRLLQQHE